jgi:FkbM family methyltransferase
VQALARPLHEFALAVIGRGSTPWVINGETFRVIPRHRREIGHHHDPAVASLLKSHLKPGAVGMNVGANVGIHVLQMARLVGPIGRVIAFEPNPAAMRVLARHVAINGFADRVTLVESAAGAAAGRATLHAKGVDQRARLGSANPALSGALARIDVPVTTLDRWCEAQDVSPDWLVIDVEGFEEDVLRGAETLIRTHPALGVVVEMHPGTWADTRTTPASMSALIDRLGRRAVSLDGAADPLRAHNIALLEPLSTVVL